MAENVVVTRTFSKAFCLAAVRCGYLVAHPNTIEALRAYYNPKSVNEFAQIAAFHALAEVERYYEPYIAATNAAREAFVEHLCARGVEARSGGAGNFVCLRVPDERSADLCRRLEERSIYVRDISGRFPGHVRITIGLEMGRVEEALAEVFAEMGLLGQA
jgi:histidinol-phosphate aminotransferase